MEINSLLEVMTLEEKIGQLNLVRQAKPSPDLRAVVTRARRFGPGALAVS